MTTAVILLAILGFMPQEQSKSPLFTDDQLAKKRELYFDLLERSMSLKVREQTIGSVPRITYSCDVTIFPAGRADPALRLSSGVDLDAGSGDVILTCYPSVGTPWRINWSAPLLEGRKWMPGHGGSLAKYVGIDASRVELREAQLILEKKSAYVGYVYTHGDGGMYWILIDSNGVEIRREAYSPPTDVTLPNGKVRKAKGPFFRTHSEELRYAG